MSAHGDNLCSLLLATIEAGQGARTAIVEGERSWTYDQLGDTVARLATGLRTLRLEPGDRVAVCMRDSLEAVAAILGCAHAGLIVVPISELARPSDIRDIINDSGAVAAIVSQSLEPSLDAIRSEAPALREVLVASHPNEHSEKSARPGERDLTSLIRASAPAHAPAPVEPTDPVLILYSAGARAPDGKVRGVVHTHRAPKLAFESISSSMVPMDENSRIFSVVRLSTAYGLGFGLFFPLAAGCKAILLSEQPRSGVVLSEIERHKPTIIAATPSVYRQLAQDVRDRGLDAPLASVSVCIAGAEDMPSRVIEKVEAALGAKITVGYGLTEAFQFVVAAGAHDGREGACGRPLPGFELRIVNDNDEPVGSDEIGTLEIRGSVLSPCYFYLPDLLEEDPLVVADQSTETSGITVSRRRSRSESLPLQDAEGWLTTRDRFMRDADGFFYHCGRIDHLFKVGGKWVAPDEVERALLGHEAVWECAVIGVDDEDGLMKPIAYVVANIGHEPGAALDQTLREYVKSEIAPYKYPRWIEFVNELPKGPSGKLLRYKLHEMARGDQKRRRAETASDNP